MRRLAVRGFDLLCRPDGKMRRVGSCLGQDALFVQWVKIDAVTQVFQAQQAQLQNLTQEVCCDSPPWSVQVL